MQASSTQTRTDAAPRPVSSGLFVSAASLSAFVVGLSFRSVRRSPPSLSSFLLIIQLFPCPAHQSRCDDHSSPVSRSLYINKTRTRGQRRHHIYSYIPSLDPPRRDKLHTHLYYPLPTLPHSCVSPPGHGVYPPETAPPSRFFLLFKSSISVFLSRSLSCLYTLACLLFLLRRGVK